MPDNLIFHLKRFEFDLNDFSRRKINDYFEFPRSIDISEYHFEYLSDTSNPREEDIFDLVGVLVHSGTCENGHYYSYIRERPHPLGCTPAWVEFDDANVGPFDPADIAPRAFGGFFEEPYGGRTMKNFSAYMLFYQRRSAIDDDQNNAIATVEGAPIKIHAPIPILEDVNLVNDNFIREYCFLDPTHSRFVRQLHSACRQVNHESCSLDHAQVSVNRTLVQDQSPVFLYAKIRSRKGKLCR